MTGPPAPIVVPFGLRRVGLDPPPAALHLAGGHWHVSCPTCGHPLATSRTQEKAEQWAEILSCPICQDVA